MVARLPAPAQKANAPPPMCHAQPMALLTIAADLGTGGDEIAGRVAESTGLSLVDREGLVSLAQEMEPAFREVADADELEERVGGRLNALALGLAMTAGSSEAFRELRFRQALPEIARRVLARAMAQPAVIVASAAFAALADHPAAVHVRLRAPRDWRVESHHRRCLIDRAAAERAVKHDDHIKHAWVRELYGADLDDPARFAIVLDVSRFSEDLVVAILAASVSG